MNKTPSPLRRRFFVCACKAIEVFLPIREQLQWSWPILLLLTASGAVLLRKQVTPLASKLLRSELRVRTVVENVGDGIITFDQEGAIETFNAAATSIFGYTADEVIGSNVLMLMPAETHESHTQGIKRYLASGESHVIGKKSVELPGLRKDGSRFSLELAVSAITIVGEQSFVGIFRDVTERKQAEAVLYSEKERLRVTLGSIGDGVITTDVLGLVTYLNRAAETMTGWTSVEAVGKPLPTIFNIVHEQTNEPAANPAETVLRDNVTLALPESRVLIHRGGSKISIEDSAAPIHDIEGQLVGVVLVFYDVSQARLMAAEMNYQATHDAMTGLVNRREFDRRLVSAIRSGSVESSTHSVLFLDLDRFKIVNDTCGHAAGDELLRQLSKVLRDKLRKSDTLSRLGGDEFAVLLENCSAPPALRIAEMLRLAVSEFLFVWASHNFSIGVSIGSVTFICSGEISNEDVLRMADAACYAAKHEGRNRVHIYTADDAKVVIE